MAWSKRHTTTYGRKGTRDRLSRNKPKASHETALDWLEAWLPWARTSRETAHQGLAGTDETSPLTVGRVQEPAYLETSLKHYTRHLSDGSPRGSPQARNIPSRETALSWYKRANSTYSREGTRDSIPRNKANKTHMRQLSAGSKRGSPQARNTSSRETAHGWYKRDNPPYTREGTRDSIPRSKPET